MTPATLLCRTFILATLFVGAGAHAQSMGWQLTEKQDELTDEAITTATFAELDSRQGAVVRCKNRKLETYFSFGKYLGNKLTTVRYRIDKQPLIEEYWSPSADGTALFAREEAGIARAMLSGTNIVLEAKDFRGQPHRASFDLEGASVAIEPVLRACGTALEGLEQQVPGLSARVAQDLERWGPVYTQTQKEILASKGLYSGPIDSTIEPAFALAAQAFYDDYVARCKSGKTSGMHCRSMKLSWQLGKEASAGVGSLIYEESSGALKRKAGNLKIKD